jgi:hypothetical protein
VTDILDRHARDKHDPDKHAVDKRKLDLPSRPLRRYLASGFAILCGAAVLTGLQVQNALAQVTHVTAVSATGVATKHRDPAPPAEGTAAAPMTTAAVHPGAAAAPEEAAPAAPAAKPARKAAVSKLGGRFFVDFRARTAASYGHAFIWYGQLTPQGKVGLIEVAGLHPATDNPVPYILGHIMPVPSEHGKSYGDLDEQYLTANYRVYLSEPDAKRVFAYIQHLEGSSPLWMATVYNCTAFLADVARFMGMRAPLTATWMLPEDFINKLREMNAGKTEVVVPPEGSNDYITRLLR